MKEKLDFAPACVVAFLKAEKMDVSNGKKQEYTNVPMAESSLMFSSDSVTSRTPLAFRNSPSPESPHHVDTSQENPYEIPIDFNNSRLRHEEHMIAQRKHLKKKSPLYELTKVNGVNSRSIARQFSDEDESEVRYVHHNDKKYKCLFIWLFILVVIALGSSAAGMYVLVKHRVNSSQASVPEKATQTDGIHNLIITVLFFVSKIARSVTFLHHKSCHRKGVAPRVPLGQSCYCRILAVCPPLFDSCLLLFYSSVFILVDVNTAFISTLIRSAFQRGDYSEHCKERHL